MYNFMKNKSNNCNFLQMRNTKIQFNLPSKLNHNEKNARFHEKIFHSIYFHENEKNPLTVLFDFEIYILE